MYPEDFVERLVKLRMEKGVSARDMSLSIGQNAGYINSIESGKSLPSLVAFFYICDYLQISPRDFFDTEVASPKQNAELCSFINKLNPSDLSLISEMAKRLAER